jgi:hypothetical protein
MKRWIFPYTFVSTLVPDNKQVWLLLNIVDIREILKKLVRKKYNVLKSNLNNLGK